MSKINWIHLSDLHRGLKEQQGFWPNIEEQLFNDLTHMRERSGPWHILFFTGDLVQTGTPEEYKRATATLKRLYEHLNRLGSEPVFVPVPGNHDLKRTTDSAPLKKILSYIHNESIRENFWRSTQDEGRKLVNKSFSAYKSWLKSLPFPKGINTKNGILPGDHSGVVDINGLRVGYVGLNSAFLHLSSSIKKEQLAIELEQIIGVCGENFVDWFKDNTCNFLLTHHPPSWLSSETRNMLDQDILVPGRILAHLCGHLHNGVQHNLSKGGAIPQQTFQSSALFGLEHFEGENGKQSTRRHGYTIGQIDIQSTKSAVLTVWPRNAYKTQAGPYQFSQDHTATLDANGAITFDRIHLNNRKDIQKKKNRTYTVLLISTDTDLKYIRTTTTEHLIRSLGVEVKHIPSVNVSYDICILIQGWWWDNGSKADMWRRSKSKNKFIYTPDPLSDWPPRRLTEHAAEQQIQNFITEFQSLSTSFTIQEELPELITKQVTELMQQTFGSQFGLMDYERRYLEFRLPTWRMGRTAKARPHLFDAQESDQLYQPGLYVEMDGVCRGWSANKDGIPERRIALKGRTAQRFEYNSRVALPRWIGIDDLPRIAFIGAPGGGKTIFLTRIASILASACLGRPRQFDTNIDLERLRKEFGLPIPIVIEATSIAAIDSLDATSLLTAIADELASGCTSSIELTSVEEAVKTGRYLLLIDALDEIADPMKRTQVLALLKGIAGVFPEARFIITTRSARYTGDLRFGPEIQTVEVAPLSIPQVNTLCSNWTTQRLQDHEYRSTLTAAAKGLSGTVSSTADEQSITENPLMLTAICMVFERYRSLPDDRGRLCELLVDDLCRSRRSEDTEKSWKLDENGKKSLLQRIALAMQEEGAQSWPIEKAINIARQQVPTTEKEPNLLATKLVDWAADHTGILRFQEAKNDSEQVRFWHRLFREHLAATRIAQSDMITSDTITKLWKQDRLSDPFWEDVIRLLPRALSTIEKANSVRISLEELAKEYPDKRGRLFGLMMAGIIENRDLFPEVAFTQLAEDMATTFTREGYNWPFKDRILFLESLGRLDPTSGDPRNFEAWSEVPPLQPHTTKSTPETSVSPKATYRSWLSQYLVTVQEFKQFIMSTEFQDAALWANMPQIVLRTKNDIKSRIRPQFSHPNWPVVHVGVGEAIAYCRWKTLKRNDGMQIRLPNSSEWTSIFRKHPHAKWSDLNNSPLSPEEPDANMSLIGFPRPTPVGAFPPHFKNIYDAFGNTWEWCILTHATGGKRSDHTLGSFHAFGGSYMLPPQIRDEFEVFAKPPSDFEYNGDSTIGFRCALSEIRHDISPMSFSPIENDYAGAARKRRR